MKTYLTIALSFTAAFSGVGQTKGILDKNPTETCTNGLVYVICHGSNPRQRLNAVHSLSTDLNQAEIKALYEFLESHPGTDRKTWVTLHYLKNDVLTALQNQTEPPQGLADVMVGIYNDPAQDLVTRDYAIQHLITWYSQGAHGGEDARARIRATLLDAAGQNDSIAGTALLGLHRLSKSDPISKSEEIKRIALRLIETTEISPAAKVTAIQVCAEREIVEALPAVEQLAQGPGDMALKVSAISALGRLGGPAQAVLLRHLDLHTDKMFKPAIQSALERLDYKLASRTPF